MRSRIWAYPWDLIDEGLQTSLARIAAAGIQEISLAAAYHGAMLLLPHNPRRRVYFLEDGVVYFRPDLSFYAQTPIKPIPSELTADQDPLRQIAEAAALKGLGTVAWTVTLHNSRLGLQFPELTMENAFGDRYPYGLCPSQPAVRQFLCALVRDLSRYPLAGIELEALQFMAYPHGWTHAKEGVDRTELHEALLSLCFCDACQMRAAGQLDMADLRTRTRALLESEFSLPADRPGHPAATPEQIEAILPGYAALARVRTEAVSSLLSEAKAGAGVPLLAILGTGVPRRPWAFGVDPAHFARTCNGLTVSNYSPDLPTVQRDGALATALAGAAPVHLGYQVMPPSVRSLQDLQARIRASAQVGAAGVSLYNYGLMPLPHLDWIRSSLEVVSRD